MVRKATSRLSHAMNADARRGSENIKLERAVFDVSARLEASSRELRRIYSGMRNAQICKKIAF